MKKNLILLLALLFTLYGCEQDINSGEILDNNYEDALSERKASPPTCDLTEIALYIPPAEIVPGKTMNFDHAFPVTTSKEYETANNVNLDIAKITYRVNGSASNNQFNYQGGRDYDLILTVDYLVNQTPRQETFSLCFTIEGRDLNWDCTSYCEYDDSGAGAVEDRSGGAVLIMP